MKDNMKNKPTAESVLRSSATTSEKDFISEVNDELDL